MEGGKNGTAPGDVGVYTADRGFEKLFNIWDDELGIQTVAESLGGVPYQPPKRTLLLRQNTLREGDMVVRGVSTRTLQTTSEALVNLTSDSTPIY